MDQSPLLHLLPRVRGGKERALPALRIGGAKAVSIVKKRALEALVDARLPTIPMPEGFNFRMNGERCDMIQGPCACGAWHRLDDWGFDIRVAVRTLQRRGHR